MPRKLTGDIHWIHETHHRPPFTDYFSEQDPDWYIQGEEMYSVHNAYVVKGDRNLLFDTLTPVNPDQIESDLSEILDGEPLDYLVLSHPEAPHAGNTFKVLDEHPEATLVVPDTHSSTHDLYHLADAIKVQPGDYIDLGDYVLEFVEPFFLDHEMHTWMFERSTKTLFTVDWIGHGIMESEHLKFADEVESKITPERIYTHNGIVFFWWEYVDTAKTDLAIERIIEDFDPEVLANAHGLPVRKDATKHARMMKKVIDIVRETGKREMVA